MTEKTIAITGKHNIDKINNVTSNKKTVAKRLHMDDLQASAITHKAQIDMCHKLYMSGEATTFAEATTSAGATTFVNFPLKSLLESELNKKIQGYKAQDMKKDMYDGNALITFIDTLEKLIASKLRCYYCKREVVILYKNVREPMQWTLDRIDNNQGHSKANTIIACLKCNLQRRVTDMEKFTFTKHLKITKTDFNTLTLF